MNDDLLGLLSYLAELGPAYVPAGEDVLYLLGWDQYTNYYEVNGRLNYINEAELAFVSYDGKDVKFRQTIHLLGHGRHVKHQCAFAVSMGSDVESVTTVRYGGRHPGRGQMAIRDMKMGYDDASVWSPGTPTGILFRFKRPVIVKRWSCMPITAGVVEHDVFVYEITLWAPTEDAADRAARVFAKLAAEAPEETGPRTTLAPPQFTEVPSMPGSIRRR